MCPKLVAIQIGRYHQDKILHLGPDRCYPQTDFKFVFPLKNGGTLLLWMGMREESLYYRWLKFQG